MTRPGKEGVAIVVDSNSCHPCNGTEDFKTFLTEGPRFDALDIKRDEAPALIVKLR